MTPAGPDLVVSELLVQAGATGLLIYMYIATIPVLKIVIAGTLYERAKRQGWSADELARVLEAVSGKKRR